MYLPQGSNYRSFYWTVLLVCLSSLLLPCSLNILRLDGSFDTNNQLCYKLLDYCRQISSAMCYLSSKAFIHRDLAARNILVAADEACKVGNNVT